MLHALSLALVLSSIPSSLARLIPPIAQCVDGCNAAFDGIIFTNLAEQDYYKTRCATDVVVKSQLYCVTIYCSPAEIAVGLPLLNDSCKTYSEYSLPSYEAVMGARIVDPKLLDSVRRVNQTSTETYAEPVVPDEDMFFNGYGTASAFDNNYVWSWYYGYACIGYWALVLAIGIINRAFIALKRFTTDHKNPWDVVSRPLLVSQSTSTWLRRSLILPGTFGGRVQHAFGEWGTIPPRLETLLLVSFIILNFIFCFPGYNIFVGNIYYPDTRVQLARYVADRTGIISFAKFPLIWLFAMRNDPFLWLTGWSFAAYNRFHRWVARLATVEAIVHSLAYSALEWLEGGDAYAKAWQDEYWYMGGVATITMSLLLGASAYWLRQRYYDLFRLLHIALALVTLIGMWYHVKIFNGEYDGWFWPCVAMWSLDWLIRIIRVIYLSLIPRVSKGVKAMATYNPDTNMIRMNVTDYFSKQASRPGIFYYVYETGNLRSLESHPMTLCTWAQGSISSPPAPSSPAFASNKEIEPADRPLRTNSNTSDDLTHTFLIRPFGGWTSRLRKQLLNKPASNSTEVTVLLEGPYGEEIHLDKFTDVLIIAGGSGITAAISSSCALLQARGCKTEIHIVWAVRELALVGDVLQHELSAAAGHPRVKIDIYYTPDEEAKHMELPQSAFYTIHDGRPEIEEVLRSDRQQCSGSLAFVCCGPTYMADACRKAVVSQLHKKVPAIEFINDSMVW